MFKSNAMSRRVFFGSGTCVVAAGILKVNTAEAAPNMTLENEAIVRKYYKLWETNDWDPLDHLLASDFTFTSAAGNDHISKSDFKTQCWDTQIGDTRGFDLLQLCGRGDTAFIMYVGHTKDSRSFRNVEFMRVSSGKVRSIECYFGQKSGFATAVDAEKR